MIERQIPKKPEAVRAHELRLYHDIVHHAANNPVYIRPLSRGDQRQQANTPLKKALSPAEKAYLRAHAVRQEAYADTHKAADAAVRARLPEYPDSHDEHYWAARTRWDASHKQAMAQEITTPRFAIHLRNQVMQRTGGHLLAPGAEAFLTERHQAHLYARTGALALGKEFKGDSFHTFSLNNVLEMSLDNQQSDAVRDLLIDDGVLDSDPERVILKVNPVAVEQLSRQPVYVPPRNHVAPRRF